MPGGLLLYSTCTFAPEENEGSISYVLENFPEMEVLDLPCPSYFDRGNPQWGNGSLELSKTIRIWPHHARGEGHFIALLQKKGTAMQPFGKAMGHLTREQRTLLEGFFCDIPDFSLDAVEIRKDKVYLLPPLDINIKGIQFLRNGLYLGDLKKNRFEPSQQLALALKPGEYKNTIRLSSDDQRISRYLRGETLLIKEGESSKTKGWHLLCVDGYPLGWGKLVNGILKNKYPAGWRKSE
jgi:NOL1/NOP2/fmu family ribosome biogenesis protein